VAPTRIDLGAKRGISKTPITDLSMMKTYDIIEAAEFLKVDRTTALELAGLGELPGAKIGRAWVFMESDLVDYLRDKVRRQTNQRREDQDVRQRISDPPRADRTGQKRHRRREVPRLPESADAGVTGESPAAS
jgi:excisionase family DNA binding protein